MKKVIVITGASAGIGAEVAKQMVHLKHAVYNLSRRKCEIEGVISIETDVSDQNSVRNALSIIMETETTIDCLINNAGMGISGTIEDTKTEDAKYIFDVNFFGSFYTIREVIPIMRKTGRGTIINMSSVAAAISIPFQSFYSATKAALSAFSDSLRSEVKPFGIKIITVLPGDVKTDFTMARRKNPICHEAYGVRVERSVAVMEKDEQNGIPVSVAAKIIVNAALKKNPPLNCVIGGKYKIFLFLLKMFPARFVRFIVDKMYG